MSKLFKSDDDDFGYLDDSIHINWKKQQVQLLMQLLPLQ